MVYCGLIVLMGYWKCLDVIVKVIWLNLLKEDYIGVDLVCYFGDLVCIDEEGFLYFVGCNDVMIKLFGYWISLSDVEEVLMVIGYFV